MYKPTKKTYFNKTHKQIAEVIKSGEASTIGYFHRELVRSQNELKRNDPYGKNETKIQQYESKIKKLHRVIHDNNLYEQEAFYL